MARTARTQRRFLIFIGAILAGCLPLAAQEKPDAPDSSATSLSQSPACCSDIGRSVSLRRLPGNILADQKDIWLFPTKLAKGEHIWPAVAIAGTTAGFFASDPY